MTRQTSIESYEKIRDNGLLSKKRWEIYDTLFQSKGSITHGEVSALVESKYNTVYGGKPRKFYRNNCVARLGELRDLGVVSETGKKKCPISGMTCITWDVTENLPIKLEKPKKIKCEHCKGKGHFIEQQMRMF